jgi:hypothetical protein
VSPWVIYNLARFGTLTQDSYRALMYAQRAAVGAEGENWTTLFRNELTKGFYDYFIQYLSLPAGPGLYLFGGLLLGAALGVRLACRCRAIPREGAGVKLVLWWGALSWAFYVFWFWQQKQWYFLPVHVFLALGTATLIAFLDRQIARRVAARLAVGAAAATMLAGFVSVGAAHWISGFHPWQRTYLTVAADLRAMAAAEPGLRIAAFNSGALSAFSGLPVINLDGVVNPDAARATRERRLLDYLREKRIDVVADHREILAFYRSIDGRDWSAAFSLVRSYPSSASAGEVLLLRLKPAAAGE